MVTSTITRPTAPATPASPSYFTFNAVFEITQYPAGERHVRVRDGATISSLATVEANAHNFDDLGIILTADRILRRLSVEVEWFIPYFPFARHDRRNDRLDGIELELALEVVAELNIVIADPHSEVSARLPHFAQSEVVRRFEHAGLFATNPVVIIPDAGAAKKAYNWTGGRDVVQAIKHRDPATGELSGFGVLTDDLGGRPCIIIDDICDGGGTFLGLAKELQAKNAGPLTLAVTHGLFTKGTASLAESFAAIACLARTAVGPASDTASAELEGVITIPFSDLYIKGETQ